jgi:Cu+-exporting ATPase
MNKQTFNVTGMTCSACSAHVEKAVSRVAGVQSVTVNLLSNSMTVEFDAPADAEALLRAVEDAGYGASVPGAQTSPAGETERTKKTAAQDELRGMRTRLAVSLLFLIPLMYLSMGHMLGWPLPAVFHGIPNTLVFALTQFLLCLPIAYVNRKFYIAGFRSLLHGAPNMDTLIAIGSGAALAYGVLALYQIGYGLGHGDMVRVSHYAMDLYFESAAMILALITLGKYLETRSKKKTGDAIARLMDLRPQTATVERDGEETVVPAAQVRAGDIVVLRPGQSVPVDGVIISGATSVDESALTGESIPVARGEGDTLRAATLNKTGLVRLRATRVGEDTTLSQIIRLVEEAGNSKAPIAKLADRISGVFVPVVIVIALAAGLIWYLLGYGFQFALSIAISVLVISCPCALGLATPVAIMVGAGRGAQLGVLIKSGEALETAHSLKTVVLDKTGTLTEGKPRVTDVALLSSLSEKEFLSLCASVEDGSEHPLSEAILEHARSAGISYPKADRFEALPGRGVRAQVAGKTILAGNAQLLAENGVHAQKALQTGERFAAQGKTPLYFARGEQVLGVIAVADVVKPTSRAGVARLQAMGLDVVMLTGDHEKTAQAIAAQLGISHILAQVLPQDKEAKIRELQAGGARVAMVGDGINDAPALARADVGIAIGAGTDVAIESADIVLMTGDVGGVATAIELSRKVIANIKMNLFWAFFYNAVGIPLAAGALYALFNLRLSPMFAAAAMSLSSVCVVTNALRLRFFKPHAAQNPTEVHVETPAEIPADVPADGVNEPQKQPVDEQKEEDSIMKKIITVEGMHCAHCQASVEKALGALEGVKSAKVDLEKKTATVTLSADVADEVLKKAVADAGFEPQGVTTKKGLFA